MRIRQSLEDSAERGDGTNDLLLLDEQEDCFRLVYLALRSCCTVLYSEAVVDPCIDSDLRAEAVPDEMVIDEAVMMLKGFADPTRLKLLALLRDGEVCVHQLVEALGMSQSAVSHQLRTLRAARLVSHRKRGRHVYYRLADGHVREMLTGVLSHSAEVV